MSTADLNAQAGNSTQQESTQDRGKLLILDDEADLRALLSRYLGGRGYRVRQVENASQLDTALSRESFDLLILDVMMPEEDGLSICRRLRNAGETIPIIMLTARGDAIDRIVGLEMGADDYLPKPFEPRELLARIEALLRRQHMLGAQVRKQYERAVQFGPWRFDPLARELCRDGESIQVHSSEFELLRALAANADRPLSRERLIEISRGRNAEMTERSVDVQIMRLRRILEDNPAEPKYVQTVRSLGYVLVTGQGHHD
ncbi:response regulator [Pokkaliibacter sp. CJK22405]|uniref:response regulator n=1 Tax=Pokkaliibacter sp. CJK22405 TaxID=3384615 RepID=UPI003984DDD4